MAILTVADHEQQALFISLLEAARQKESLAQPYEDVMAAYMEASAACPARAEALHGAARFCRFQHRHELGYKLAVQGLAIGYPADALQVEDWIYEYGLLDELAVTAYWSERYEACVDACDRLLNEGKLPAEQRDRVEKNKNFAADKIQELAALSSPDADIFLKLLAAAREQEKQPATDEQIIAAYRKAADSCPQRAEALHAAARFCRIKNLHEQAYELAAQGLNIACPSNLPAVETWIYKYGLLDEWSIAAYWTARYQDCIDACDKLLGEGKLPADQRDRVLSNRHFAIEKLRETAEPPPTRGAYSELLLAARAAEQAALATETVIAAYQAAAAADPQRAEALHGAARYCRQHAMHDRGYEFASQGLAIACPDDVPADEAWIYQHGLQQELAIVANYARDPARKNRGFAACNWLALNREVAEPERNIAISNLYFYLQPAAAILPSFSARQVEFETPAGYYPLNPSIARLQNRLVLIQRAVNYTVDHSLSENHLLQYASDDGVFRSRNFLLTLTDDLTTKTCVEILPPDDMPAPAFPRNLGFQDLRPFVWQGELWCSGYIVQLTPEGWNEQVMARIDGHGFDHQADQTCRLADWRVITPSGPRGHEKNWMPFIAGDKLQFIYQCDPFRLVDEHAQTITESTAPFMAKGFRGGSQAIGFDGGWLALVHETRVRDARRQYRHRFIWLDDTNRLRQVSRPFIFHKHGIEFAAGLAWHPDGKRLVISYGIDDREAWLATVDAGDIRKILEDTNRLAAGWAADPQAAQTRAVPQNPPARIATPARLLAPFRRAVSPAAPPLFIHSAPRTSSTWFWGKFRVLPSIIGFYESFNEAMAWITRAEAATRSGKSWDSRHAALGPYYQEYLRLIKKSGGVRLFDPAMTIQWFVPSGGLQGDLRHSEKRYLALLIRQAARDAKQPVFGGWRTLGRIRAIKNTFGGVHIFQYRNLWQQWLSYCYYKNRGDFTFYNTIVDTINRSDDEYFIYLKNFYLPRVTQAPALRSPKRGYVNIPGTEETARLLEALAEPDIFAIFMATHIYLYLHAQAVADLSVDVTRMARDTGYRYGVERDVVRHTRLPVSFSDISDADAPQGVKVNAAGINWDQIQDHAIVAQRILSQAIDLNDLSVTADQLISDTIAEIEKTSALAQIQ